MTIPKNIGRLVITSGLNNAQLNDPEVSRQLTTALSRYLKGDWGDCDEEDKAANDSAVQKGDDRILARYSTSAGDIFIITEYDRSYTTLMFRDEY